MTPQQLKAMKLALSTLKEVQSETFRLLRNGQRLYAEEKVWNTIIEIKQALAEHAMSEVQRLGQEIEQEPVAHCKVRLLRGDESFPKVEIDWVNQPVPGPLYIAPPQRKPLTEQEIGAILEDINAFGTRLYTFARAIEVAHGIKGDA